jgi:AbrB family looped-hinge helix DNA binding protein
LYTRWVIKLATIIEMGTVSSRGQIAIPSDIRTQLGLIDGSKVIFFTEDDTLVMKKVTTKTFAEVTKPLKEAVKKAGLKEEDVPNMIHRFRKTK